MSHLIDDETTEGAPKLRVAYDEQEEEIRYARPGDAGIDLRAAESCVVFAGQRKTIRCGIRMALPKGTVGLVCPRSGLARDRGITVLNAPGIVDEGHRGEICVVLLNTDEKSPLRISKGDRIAQLVVVPFASCEIEIVEELDDDTERGDDGFGSSGRS